MADPLFGLGSEKYALAIHTASPELGLAIRNGAGSERSQTWNLGRDLSTQLHVHLNEFLHPQQWSDLAFIAVAKGPGGFTGTRIGVVTARTLAQQLNIPLFSISTLKAFAWATLQQQSTPSPSLPNQKSRQLQGENTDIAIEMAARRGDVYCAVYTVSKKSSRDSDNGVPPLINQQLIDQRLTDQPILSELATEASDTVMSQEQWHERLSSWPKPYQIFVAENGLGWTVPSLLDLAVQRWSAGDRPCWSHALPYYGQSPV
ncbi:MAG: tRNA (adenosine(37)-N6)-threonylcarbamoyltransferase complex dimerization subunit type 1 TsaB [Cyanobacteria bacterium J06633_2]